MQTHTTTYDATSLNEPPPQTSTPTFASLPTGCLKVRSRDFRLLANSGLRLRAIIIGQEADKPWITNRGLDYIGLIKGLQHLALRNCHSVTNKGVAALSSLVNLYSLEL